MHGAKFFFLECKENENWQDISCGFFDFKFEGDEEAKIEMF